MSNKDARFDDRALTEADDAALPKPQIEIIVDGNSVFKPSMRTLFVDEYDEGKNEYAARVMGEYCSCDAVVSTHTVCTCLSVCTCNTVATPAPATPTETVCSCDSVCTCLSVCSCDGYQSCTCVSNTGGGGYVSCGSPCACVPVH